MNEKSWPPDGHKFDYQVTEQLDGLPEVTFFMSLPSVPGGEIQLPTCRVGRLGGATEEDRIFRQALYSRVGAAVIASGHAEAAMKRVLLLLKGETAAFSTVDMSWTGLRNALTEQVSTGRDEQLEHLAETLAWADANRVKERRDNIVHAYWWNHAGVGVRRARFFRRTDGVIMQGTLEDLEADAAILFEYAERLDALIVDRWPQAMLPKPDV